MELAGLPDWPLGLSKDEAAAYVGLSAGTFDAQVDAGVFPKPIPFGRRRVWHRRALDMAMDRLAGLDRAVPVSNGPSLGEIQW